MKVQAQSLPPFYRLAVTPQLEWSFNPTLNAYRLGTSTTNGWLTYLSPSPLRSNDLTRYRNINLLSIGYAFRPRLRPDSPDADQPSVGNLRFTGTMILTSFTLLVPTFSLPSAPPLLPVWLQCRMERSPSTLQLRRVVKIRRFGGWLEPRYIFGAESLDQ